MTNPPPPNAVPAIEDATEAIIPQTLIGISFPDLFRAQEFLVSLQRLAAHGDLVLEDAVVVKKTEDGQTMVHETIDPQAGRTALSGGMWTGLFGLILGGPVGWLAGAAIGAGAGALTAKVIDLGISDEWVAWFREAVQPDTATVAVLASEIKQDALVAEIHRFAGASLVYANFDEEMRGRITDALEVDPA